MTERGLRTNSQRPPLFLWGVPGAIGGAATKISHLIRLLHNDFEIKLVAMEPWVQKDRTVRRVLEPFGILCLLAKSIPRGTGASALAICDKHFFVSGRARQLKELGLRVVWSNEMMWPFEGEQEAVEQGLIDRVLFASDFQASAFVSMYKNIPSFVTGNYIDPDDYCWRQRSNPFFTMGRLSRADTNKYPVDFPVFYEEIGLREARYRVMAWSLALQRQYRWHRFGPEWELLPEYKESALKFLYSLDVFLYPLGHRVKESWGRAVVEAMLTGCVPVVPAGHQFHVLIKHGETGFICRRFLEYRDCVHELYEDYGLRQKIGRAGSEYAREVLCDRETHRQRWIQALSF
jgi:glycosyltransferase involved in cell wall biosynthesis